MKLKTPQKLFAAVVLATASFSTSSFAQECDSTDNIKGWGAWCGVDTYLSQQAPTAAGGQAFSGSPFQNPQFDSSKFGGDLIEQTESQMPEAQFMGYGLMNIYTFSDDQLLPAIAAPNEETTNVLARIYLEHDEVNESVQMKAVLEDGSIITVVLDEYYKDRWTPNESYGEIAVGAESEEYVEAYSGKEGLNTYSGSAYLTNISGYTYNNEQETETYYLEDEISFGTVYISMINFEEGTDFPTQFSNMGGFIGTPTPIDAMRNLQGEMIYNLEGGYASTEYSRTGTFEGTMNVNFSSATWSTDQIAGVVSASGNINGNKFSADQINSIYQGKQVVSDSYINGQFTGSQAQNLVGQGNINLQSIEGNNVENIKTVFTGTRTGEYTGVNDGYYE